MYCVTLLGGENTEMNKLWSLPSGSTLDGEGERHNYYTLWYHCEPWRYKVMWH